MMTRDPQTAGLSHDPPPLPSLSSSLARLAGRSAGGRAAAGPALHPPPTRTRTTPGGGVTGRGPRDAPRSAASPPPRPRAGRGGGGEDGALGAGVHGLRRLPVRARPARVRPVRRQRPARTHART